MLAVYLCHLERIVDALAQSRQFEYARKNHLTPVALNLAIAFERLGEVLRLLAQSVVGQREVFYLLLERSAILKLGLLVVVDGFFELVEVACKRIEDFAYALLVVGFERFCLFGENLVGEVTKHELRLRFQLFLLFLGECHLLAEPCVFFRQRQHLGVELLVGRLKFVDVAAGCAKLLAQLLLLRCESAVFLFEFKHVAVLHKPCCRHSHECNHEN